MIVAVMKPTAVGLSESESSAGSALSMPKSSTKAATTVFSCCHLTLIVNTVLVLGS